jgi:predicted DCC family thiol-disulfide oxidoreductase YuxK
MYVLYDGNCGFCRRTIALLRVFDIFERVTYVNALEGDALRGFGLHWLDSSALLKEMHGVVGRQRWTGFSAYRALILRIPILWPAVPFLYLWPIPMIGKLLYRHVADSRACDIADAPPAITVEGQGRPPFAYHAVVAVSILLLLGNIAAGIGNIHYSWPFAAYPSFEGIAQPDIESLEIVVLGATGELIPLKDRLLNSRLSAERIRGLMLQLLSAEAGAELPRRFMAIRNLWTQNDLSLHQEKSMQFYKVRLSTIPERWRENPLHRDLLFELTLTSSTPGSKALSGE